MAHELDIGISKIARQKVIDRLKHAYASDYLEDDDFEKRLVIATNTKKRSELIDIVDDLPDETPPSGQAPAGSPQQGRDPDQTWSLARGIAYDSDVMVGVFSGVTRRGVWRPARRIKTVAFMGGIELDFTHAEIPAEGVEIQVFAMMGGIEMRVPDGVNVRNRGFAFMGGFEDHVHGEVFPGAPTITITGFAFMGGVEVKGPRKPSFFKKFMKRMLD